MSKYSVIFTKASGQCVAVNFAPGEATNKPQAVGLAFTLLRGWREAEDVRNIEVVEDASSLQTVSSVDARRRAEAVIARSAHIESLGRSVLHSTDPSMTQIKCFIDTLPADKIQQMKDYLNSEY